MKAMSAQFLPIISLLQLALALCSFAQVVGNQQPDLRKIEIDLTHAVPLPGLPFTGDLAYPFSCSSDGDLYAGELVFDQDGRPISTLPDLYKVSPQASVRHISKPVPTATYKRLDSPGFFAGSGTLVTLIRASRPTDQNGEAHPGTDFFLSVTDSDGDHPKLIRLALDFDVVKAAEFGSGEFIILGLNQTKFEPIVALLNPEGEFEKYLEVFPGAKDTGIDSAADKAKKRDLFTEIGAAQFVPWGADVLMAIPGIDTSSVYHFRSAGQSEKVDIKFPADQQVAGILGSGGKDSWVIRAQSAESAEKMAKVHLVENPEEFLYEVSPRTGELLRKLDISGPHPGEVACAADSRLTAIYVGNAKQGAADQLVLASARR
jgi:hypothetical protein